MFADIVTAEENKEHTMKNTISFGISRTELFLAKIISTILVAFSVALVTVAAYMGSAFVLLRPESNDISSLLLNLFFTNRYSTSNIYSGCHTCNFACCCCPAKCNVYLCLLWGLDCSGPCPKTA